METLYIRLDAHKASITITLALAGGNRRSFIEVVRRTQIGSRWCWDGC